MSTAVVHSVLTYHCCKIDTNTPDSTRHPAGERACRGAVGGAFGGRRVGASRRSGLGDRPLPHTAHSVRLAGLAPHARHACSGRSGRPAPGRALRQGARTARARGANLLRLAAAAGCCASPILANKSRSRLAFIAARRLAPHRRHAHCLPGYTFLRTGLQAPCSTSQAAQWEALSLNRVQFGVTNNSRLPASKRGSVGSSRPQKPTCICSSHSQQPGGPVRQAAGRDLVGDA